MTMLPLMIKLTIMRGRILLKAMKQSQKKTLKKEWMM